MKRIAFYLPLLLASMAGAHLAAAIILDNPGFLIAFGGMGIAAFFTARQIQLHYNP